MNYDSVPREVINLITAAIICIKINNFYMIETEEKMRIHEVMYYVKTYFVLGVIGLFILGFTGVFGYFVVYKKILGGKRRISKKQLIIGCLFTIYMIMVLGVTFLSRGSHFKGSVNLNFLSSYKEAWYSFSFRDWQYIILNIFMFVPFGFLLPLLNKRFQKLRYTFIATLLFTLLIESFQYISGKGIYELDDIFNNTLGGIIGYGIIMVIISLVQPMNNKGLKIIGYLSPLLVTASCFVGMFVYYENKEFGNLAINYVQKIDLKNTSVNLDMTLSDKKSIAPIYKAPTYTKDEAKEYVKDLFQRMDIEAEDIEIDAYSDNALYWRRGEPTYSVWFYNISGRYRFSDFSSFGDDVEPEDTDEATLLDILNGYEIYIPSEAEFIEGNTGTYSFKVDKYMDGDTLIDGELECEFYSDNTIKHISNNLIEYEKVKDVTIKSEQEAYKELQDGKFHYYNGENIGDILINNLSLDYEMDTKGYLQPVYLFQAKVDGNEVVIKIPAMD